MSDEYIGRKVQRCRYQMNLYLFNQIKIALLSNIFRLFMEKKILIYKRMNLSRILFVPIIYEIKH
jgi:hypothetical protein